jgi:acetolactate synthase-1/2/3 large subunit
MAKKLPNGQFVSPPLEDMGPFLPREEFEKNMLIPLWKE